MMMDHWGEIPDSAWKKVKQAYGEQVVKAFHASIKMVSNRKYLKQCLHAMHMEEGLVDRIPVILGVAPEENDWGMES
jgi:hypothetical protein